MIKRIGHLMIYVKDLNKMLDFYINVLKFEKVVTTGIYTLLKTENNSHHDLAFAVNDQKNSFEHIAFELESMKDLGNYITILQNQNVKIERYDYGISECMYFQDPEGNTIELFVDTRQERNIYTWNGEEEKIIIKYKSMIKAIVSDFSRVVLFPKDTSYLGGLNNMHDDKSVNADYNFWDHYVLNKELLNKYNELKLKYRVACFTTGHIQEYPVLKTALSDTFESVLTVEEIGLKKNTPEAYTNIANLMSLKPDEILFIDDTVENIEAAKLAGMQTHNYLDNELLFDALEPLL